jgi:hydroxyacylglutathione hydrolase
VTAAQTKDMLGRGEALLLDVRDPPEWTEDGYVEGAKLIFFADLPQKTAELPKDKPIVVTCSVGNRSSIAASILERAGFRDISNMLGGITAWTTLGYPLTKHL